jgi:hypothetical protein
MKDAAQAMPMDLTAMAKGIVSQQFPSHLSRFVIMNGKRWRVQFSHDLMPGGGRTLAHLSFLNEEGSVPDDESRQRFIRAFFGENAKICPDSNMVLLGKAKLEQNEIILIPSTRGPQVVQMGKML